MLKHLLFLLLLAASAVAQELTIPDFEGLTTDADLEDVKNSAATSLKNLEPKNGRLLKTFGYGSKIGTASPTRARGFVTFSDNNMTWDTSTAGRAYLVDTISATGAVGLRVWSGAAWVAPTFKNTMPASYFDTAYTPIVKEASTLRLLPGNKATLGANDCKGIWLGWIGREYFDGLYKPDTGWYAYNTPIDTPNYTFTLDTSKSLSCSLATGFWWYKYSQVYDDVQEGLLSTARGVDKPAGAGIVAKLIYKISKTNHNKRITALNIYRSTSFDSAAGYNKIATIDYGREKPTSQSKDTIYWGGSYLNINDLSSYTFGLGVKYTIAVYGVNADSFEIFNKSADSLTGSGHVIFVGAQTKYYWDRTWKLFADTSGAPAEVMVASGSHYFGGYTVSTHNPTVILVNTNYNQNSIQGDYLCIKYDDVLLPIQIQKNYNRAISVSGFTISTRTDSMTILKNSEGAYTCDTTGDTAKYVFFDPGVSPGAAHPLAGEVSIDVNGKYARAIGGRLWQADVILDPYNTKEAHADWLMYSELEQYDVMPVSNAFKIGSGGGGAITGLSECLGDVLVTKKREIYKVDISNASPANWSIIESFDNLGNVAERGMTTVRGVTYVTDYSGIYQLTPNAVAASHQTPTINLCITTPIQDIWDVLTTAEKESTIVGYDAMKDELHYKFGSRDFAFNIGAESWREITTATHPIIYTPDEAGNLLAYASDKKVYSTAAQESVGVEWQSKEFVIDDESPLDLKYMFLTYKSTGSDLLAIFYTNNDTTPKDTITYPDTSTVSTVKRKINIRGLKFKVKIKTRTDSKTDTVEIYKIRITR